MLKNYFKIAWRNLGRNKLRTTIHVLGLSLGISICFMIFNVVLHANSFDKFHPDGDRIYRINSLTAWGNEEAYPSSGTPGPIGEVIDTEVTGVEEKGRLYTLYDALVAVPESNKVLGRTNEATFADPGFFRIFPRTWLAGNPETALQNPNSAVITESQLEKYFPGVKPLDGLGKEILWVDADTVRAQVTGVIADYTENTDLIFKDFISFSTIQTEEQKDWYGLNSWGNINSSSQLFIEFSFQGFSQRTYLYRLDYIDFSYAQLYQSGNCPSHRSCQGSRHTKNTWGQKDAADRTVSHRDLPDGFLFHSAGVGLGGGVAGAVC